MQGHVEHLSVHVSASHPHPAPLCMSGKHWTENHQETLIGSRLSGWMESYSMSEPESEFSNWEIPGKTSWNSYRNETLPALCSSILIFIMIIKLFQFQCCFCFLSPFQPQSPAGFKVPSWDFCIGFVIHWIFWAIQAETHVLHLFGIC